MEEEENLCLLLEEKLIVVGLQQCAKCGGPCDRADIKIIVKIYLDQLGKQTCFTNIIQGEDWISPFQKQ